MAQPARFQLGFLVFELHLHLKPLKLALVGGAVHDALVQVGLGETLAVGLQLDALPCELATSSDLLLLRVADLDRWRVRLRVTDSDQPQPRRQIARPIGAGSSGVSVAQELEPRPSGERGLA